MAGVAGITAASGRVLQGGGEGAGKRPNILFLMTDQHRGDCMGCAGNKAIRTPNLDRIAREGMVFPNAFSSTPTCTPARSGLLTGMSPWNHGMLGYGKVAERYPFEMPRAMRDAGYYTFAIGKLHYHPQRNYHGYHDALLDESGRVESPDFISDYRKWFQEQAPDLDPDATGIGFNDCRAREYALPEELHPTRWTGDRAVDFISAYKRPEPLFLKVSFARPHSPYDPPSRFMGAYRDADMPLPFVGDWSSPFADLGDPANNDRWHGDLGSAHARRSRRGYYGSVSFIDEQIGRVVDALKHRDMLGNTLIVFVADHGDMLGDHHLWRKSYAYQGSAHIPMILRWPAAMGQDELRGTRPAAVTELRDLLPTFLDTAGAEMPGSVEGRSLLDLVAGQADGWRRWIAIEHSVCYSPQNHYNALTDGRWKYIFHALDGHEQLFDLKQDPGEERDLSADSDSAGTLALWRSRLVEHLAIRGENWVRDGRLIPRPQGTLYSPNYPDA